MTRRYERSDSVEYAGGGTPRILGHERFISTPISKLFSVGRLKSFLSCWILRRHCSTSLSLPVIEMMNGLLDVLWSSWISLIQVMY